MAPAIWPCNTPVNPASSLRTLQQRYVGIDLDRLADELGRVSKGLVRALRRVMGWTAKPCSTMFSGT
jgi:hypothetical protein